MEPGTDSQHDCSAATAHACTARDWRALGSGAGEYEEVALSEGRGSAEAIAQAFVEARQSGRGFADYPGALPASLDEAYAIQQHAIGLFGREIVGWKVGRIPDALVNTYGSNRLAGPIFADSVIDAPESEPEMAIFADGFGAAEAEYLLRLGQLPDSFAREWTNAAVAEFVDEIRVGIEVASSPFAGINEHGPAVTISDFGNNNGLVTGAVLPLDTDFQDWPVALLIDGGTAGTGTAAGMLDGPFGAVRFLFELARDRQLPLTAGQWISTGAITGVHQVRPGAKVEARFGDRYSVCCVIGVSRQG